MRLARPGANTATADSRTRSPRVARTRAIYLLLTLLAAAGVIVSLGWGAVSIRPVQIAGILLDKAGVASGIDFTQQQSVVLWNIRLPRVLMAAAVGAALALAGAALQVTFGNQLADPTLLGVSGAATLGVVMAYLLGAVGFSRWVLPLAACIAAIVSVLWLIGFARRHGRSDRLTLVLSGVALQLFLAGVVTLLVSAVRKPGMPDASFLTLGGLTGVFWHDVAVAVPVVVVVAALLLRRAPELNILLLGDDAARSLGVNVGRTRLKTGSLAAVATGTVVAYSGSIAFVGLVVPFLLRRLLGDDHRVLLPATVLGGVSLLTFGDAAARNLISPMELPLGVLMTVIGGPLFFWLIGRGRGVGSW